MLPRSPLRVLALCVLFAGLSGQLCVLPGPNALGSAVGTPTTVPVAPLDKTKVIVSAGASPTLLLQSNTPPTLRIHAVIAFNSSLDPSSVRVVDVTPGRTPVALGSLGAVGITPNGQLFEADVTVDASQQQSLRLQVSAAYFGDPRRARSASFDVPIVPEPVTAEANPEAVVEVDGAKFQVDQVVVDFLAGVGQGDVDSLASGLGCHVVGSEPLTNSFTLECAIDPSDPGAPASVQSVLMQLRASALVEGAWRNYVIQGEALNVDFSSLAAAGQRAFLAARIDDAWRFLPTALSSNAVSASPVKIGVIDASVDAGNAFTAGQTGRINPHPELDFGCATNIATPVCAIQLPETSPGNLDPNDKFAIGTSLGTAHVSSCGSTCTSERAKIDHGTFVSGVIGSVNHAGKGLAAQGANGILAVANAATGANSATGSDVPYQVIFAPANTYTQMKSKITQLASQVDVIVLPFGWYNAVPAGCSSAIAFVDDNPTDAGGIAEDFTAASAALRDLMRAAPGVLFVASAGNCNVDASNHIPGGLDKTVAGHEVRNLVTVAATNPPASTPLTSPHPAAGFSNFGTRVDLAAPGVGVAGPLGYPGPSVASPANTQATVASASTSTPDIATGTGTSASAAMVAGAAGLYLTVDPTLAPADLIARLKISALPIPGGDKLAGIPRLDARRLLEQTVATPTDLSILVDTTGSFGPGGGNDIDTFKAQAPSLMEELRNLGLDVAISVASFQDFPGFGGASTDVPYARLSIPDNDGGSDPVPTPLQEIGGGGTIESNVDDVSNALTPLSAPPGAGGDGPESQLEALNEIATGAGNPGFVTAGQGGVQGAAGVVAPAFRSNSSNRFVVLWTDASFHDKAVQPTYPGPTFSDVCAALNARGIKVITILGSKETSADPTSDVQRLADCTNSCVPSTVASVDCKGDTVGTTGTADDLRPGDRFICEIAADGTGIAEAIRNTVQAAASGPVTCGP